MRRQPVRCLCTLYRRTLFGEGSGREGREGMEAKGKLTKHKRILVQTIAVGVRNYQMLKVTAFQFKS